MRAQAQASKSCELLHIIQWCWEARLDDVLSGCASAESKKAAVSTFCCTCTYAQASCFSPVDDGTVLDQWQLTCAGLHAMPRPANVCLLTCLSHEHGTNAQRSYRGTVSCEGRAAGTSRKFGVAWDSRQAGKHRKLRGPCQELGLTQQ